jgi:HlyD family secretion protein
MNLKSFLQTRVLVAVVAVFLIATVFVACRSKGVDAQRYNSEAIDRGDITQTVSANGTLNPVTLVSVGTQVSGTVKKLFVDFNDRVKEGQVLVMLDDALLKAALTQDSANLHAAENALRVANNNRQRVRDLAKEGFVSQQELDTAEQASQDAQAKVTQLKAAVEKDTANVGYSVIRSPVSGVVVSRSVDAGQTVAASFNTPELFKIAKDLSAMQIDAYFAEADIGQIKLGQKVKFRVDAFSGQRFTGNVKQIRLNPKTDSNVVTYDVVIEVANPDEKLLPGMTAYVDIGVQHRSDVLRVPNAALRFKPTNDNDVEKPVDEKAGEQKQSKSAGAESGRKPGAAKAAGEESSAEDGHRGRKGGANNNMGRVYVLRDGKLLQLRMKTGITDRRFTELSGDELKAGDQVVVEEVDPKNAGKAAGQPRGMQFGM